LPISGWRGEQDASARAGGLYFACRFAIYPRSRWHDFCVRGRLNIHHTTIRSCISALAMVYTVDS
jgi:hypothetical protein